MRESPPWSGRACRGIVRELRKPPGKGGLPASKRREVREVKIAVAVKIVPDSQDVAVGGNGEMDVSKARPVVSEYDLPAIEAAARVAKESPESKVVAVTAGPASIDELEMRADDSLSGLDAFATAEVLAGVIEGLGDIDLVVCGDGSADEYVQQVDVQLAERLGMPIATSVVGLSVRGGIATATRALEDCVETVELGLPAVVSVTPDFATPRIPGMKDILAAGKRPMNVSGADAAPQPTLETIELAAPEKTERNPTIVSASEDGAIDKLAEAVKAAL